MQDFLMTVAPAVDQQPVAVLRDALFDLRQDLKLLGAEPGRRSDRTWRVACACWRAGATMRR